MIYDQPPDDAPIDQGDLFEDCPILATKKFHPEMIVDMRRLHTIELDQLKLLCQIGRRKARIQPLYREHLAKHFADTFSRIGLPRPYETM